MSTKKVLLAAIAALLASSSLAFPQTVEGPSTIYQTANVTTRAPGPNDAAPLYSVGQLWQYGGHVWQAQRVTAGNAVWTDITPAGELLDNVGWAAGAVTVTAGGTGYTAAGCTITLVSGETVNVTTVSGGAVTGVSLANWVASSAVITAGGSGNAVGDVLTLASGDVVTVAAVSSGAVTQVTLTSTPVHAAALSGAQSVSSTTGSGTGVTITLSGVATVEHPTPVSGAQAQNATTCAGTGATVTLTGAGAALAYGTHRMRAGYSTGNSIAVQRAGDASAATVSFLADGSFDEKTLWSLCANQICRVVTLYDQSGGGVSSPNATATFAAGFTVAPTNRVGSAVSIISDQSSLNDSTQLFYTLPSALSVPNRGHSVFLAYRSRGGFQITYSEIGAGIEFGNYLGGATGLNVGYFGNCPAAIPPTETAAVLGYVTSNLQYTVWNANTSNTCGESGGSSSLTGGWIGAVNGTNYSGRWEFAEYVVYARPLTLQEQTALQAVIQRDLGLFPQVRNTFVANGDSITDPPHAATQDNLDWPRQMELKLTSPARIFNLGVYGAALNNNRCTTANYNAQGAIAYQPGATNVYVVQGTWNETGMGTTAGAPAALYADQQACVAQARATGYSVIITDLLPNISMSTQKATNWQQIAGYDAAGWQSFANGYASFYNDPTIGNVSAPTGPLFGPDGVHPSNTGSGFLADIMASQASVFLH